MLIYVYIFLCVYLYRLRWRLKCVCTCVGLVIGGGVESVQSSYTFICSYSCFYGNLRVKGASVPYLCWSSGGWWGGVRVVLVLWRWRAAAVRRGVRLRVPQAGPLLPDEVGVAVVGEAQLVGGGEGLLLLLQ